MAALMTALFTRIFAFILLGAVLQKLAGARGEKPAGVFVWIALYILIPVFILLSLWKTPLPLSRSAGVAAAAVLVLAGSAVFALIWSGVRRLPFGSQGLPLIFMNSAYLAIPVNTLLWGPEGTACTILFNVIVTLANFTFGVWWASGERPLAEIAGLPVVYAALAGIALSVFAVGMPAALSVAGDLVAQVTLPAMLVFVGYRLGGLSRRIFAVSLSGALVRMAGGYLLGVCAVALLGLSGPAAGVCIMTASMPPAVHALILTERFGGDAEFAAGAVFLGTVLSLAAIPVLGYFYGGMP